MSDDPLAGLRAWIQEVETRMESAEAMLRDHENSLRGLRDRGSATKKEARETMSKEMDCVSAHVLRGERENALLDQIQRMAKSTATLQDQVTSLSMRLASSERDIEKLTMERDILVQQNKILTAQRDDARKAASVAFNREIGIARDEKGL
jgi:chromosome segregation ATPase